jgi:hypothetical protein
MGMVVLVVNKELYMLSLRLDGESHVQKTNILSLLLLMVLLVSGCGGGGDSSDENETSNETDTTNDTTDNDTSSDSTTNLRVARMRYDYDNNGTYEGLSEFFYDSNGRLSEERYSYIDDGEGDQHIAGTIQSWLGRENQDNTVTYAYNTAGLLQSWIARDSQGGATTTYTYDADNMLTRVDNVLEDGVGGVLSSTYHSLEYTDQQLTRHTHHNTDDSSLLFTYEIEYDFAGYVISTLMTSNPPGAELLYTPNYFANGLIEDVELTSQGSTGLALECSYNALNQKVRSDVQQGGFSFEYTYGDNVKITEVRADVGQDGVIETVVAIEWEQGLCEPVVRWNAMSHSCTEIDPSSPYQPGAGYLYTGHCDQGPL